MEKVAIDDVGPGVIGNDSHRRRLSEPLNTTGVALNRYRIAPGDGFPSGLHAHADQEEVFVVIEGEATFETLVRGGPDQPTEAGEVTVGAGEAIRFAPGEFQSGWNDAEEDLVALVLGAPRDSEDVRFPVACPECDHGNVHLETGSNPPAFVCPDCGAERVPRPCPECDGDDLGFTLEEDEPVVVCDDCDAAFERPPVRGEW